MSILSAIPLLGRVLGKAGDIIDKAVPDKDLATKLKADIESQALSMDHTEVTQLVEEQSSIIRAEINSPSWLAANWRPILMLTIVAIIANNYIVYPYLSMFTDKATVLELPADLYDSRRLVTRVERRRSGALSLERVRNVSTQGPEVTISVSILSPC